MATFKRKASGALLGVALVASVLGSTVAQGAGDLPAGLDQRLAAVLHSAGFTGRIESTLARRLGRPVNRRLAALGKLVFFDRIQGLHSDNSCAGCHSPAFAALREALQ